MTAKITIPGELPTMNEIIDASKTNKFVFHTMKKQTQEVCMLASMADCQHKYEKIYLKITYYRTNRRYDPDNIAAGKKFILDGLQQAGIIDNDGWKNVTGWEETWKVDKKNPRVEVELIDKAG
jgi:Holliday junction resolvase RusA-like endonuclease